MALVHRWQSAVSEQAENPVFGGLAMTQTLMHFVLSFGPYETVMVCLGIVATTLFVARAYNAHLVRMEKRRVERLAQAQREKEREVVQAHVQIALRRMTPTDDFFIQAARCAPNRSAVRPG